MKEKEAIKMSLSTFFLIIAIIVIGIMGYFLYRFNSKTMDGIANEKELKAKIESLEKQITSKQAEIEEKKNSDNHANANEKEVNEAKNTEQNSSIVENTKIVNSLHGKYIGNAEVEPGTTPDGETEVTLYLYENGSFHYGDSPGLASGHVGYYTVKDNNLILHEVVECGNDIGRTITSNTITLKVNEDNSITDSKLKATLKKASEKIEEKTDLISTELKNALKNHSLQ